MKLINEVINEVVSRPNTNSQVIGCEDRLRNEL